jgi:hypothetical protein
VRFGHRESTLHGALDQRKQPPPLLLVGSVLHEQRRIPRVRRDHTERLGGARSALLVGHDADERISVLGMIRDDVVADLVDELEAQLAEGASMDVDREIVHVLNESLLPRQG